MTNPSALPVLPALVRIDLDLADVGDVAALADLSVRSRLRGLRDDVPQPLPRLQGPWDRRCTPNAVTDPMPDPCAPGTVLPGPATAAGPTRWAAPV